ncbi:hypothetical protein [Novosphingobium sp. Rr 2-17]|nr:hypothetical protein [Novosphingobium sp. Rr 2-17]
MIDRPLHASNFAFVTYREPGGKIGAYAFHHSEGTWREEETVVLGHW